MATPFVHWQPTCFKRMVKPLSSSSCPAIIVTDAGQAYLKAVNDKLKCPAVIGCEWLGTHLARRFGLKTFEIATIVIRGGDPIKLARKAKIMKHHAIVTQSEAGEESRSDSFLDIIDNQEDIDRLVVFDTWVRNCDRHNNLFFSEVGAQAGQFIMKAMDHGHILTCGHPIKPDLLHDSQIKDKKIYWLNSFKNRVSYEKTVSIAAELATVTKSMWDDVLAEIPHEWGFTTQTRSIVSKFLLERARFLSTDFAGIIFSELYPNELNYLKNNPQE